MVGYWQNHPALFRICFRGLFIGPTSQHPRVDEARMDSLHELGNRFSNKCRSPAPRSPSLVDRIFRNLLIDLTEEYAPRGDLHRQALYPLESASTRLGLAELRALLRDAAALAYEPHAAIGLCVLWSRGSGACPGVSPS